jgi:uncharacterized protein YjiS (DUF1127 family)
MATRRRQQPADDGTAWTALAAARGRVGQVAKLLVAWLKRSSERRWLDSLNDHMLRDIGVSRAEVGKEAGRRSGRS